MKSKIKLLTTIIVFGFFIIIAIATGNSNRYGDKIDIDLTKEEMKKAIKGKWSANENYGGFFVRYRFEITDDKVKVWKIGNELNWNTRDSDWKNNPEEIVNYSIGNITNWGNGGKHIIIAEGETFGKLVIRLYEDSDEGIFMLVNGNEESSMFNDWEH